MNISRCLYDDSMFKSNMESIFLNICLILGVIHASSAQQPPVIGLESVIQAYVRAEVSKQLKESQENLIKRNEFTRVQQDVKKVTENLDNSIQGNKSNMYAFNLQTKRLIFACKTDHILYLQSRM